MKRFFLLSVLFTATLIAWADVQNIPFTCSFESNESTTAAWTFANGSNGFVVGTAASSNGVRSLYISDDGSSWNYTITNASYSYAYVELAFGSGTYDVEYDWQAVGESVYDYGRVFLAPDTFVPIADSLTAQIGINGAPDGWIAIDGGRKLNQVTGWQNVSTEVSFTKDTTVKLIVYWRNDGSVGAQPPIAFDNIRIKELTCPKPDVNSMNLDSASTDMFRLKIAGMTSGKGIIYHIASDASFADTIAASVVYDSLVTVTGLSASTWYYAKIGYICSVGDTSSLVIVRIHTNCGINTQYPYIMDFESYVAPYYKTQLVENCWLVDTYTTGINVPYHYITTTTSNVHSGSNALFISNSNSTDAYQIFAMPRIDTLAGKRLSLWFKNYGTTATYAKCEVGYLSNPDSASSFVLLQQYPLTTSYTEAVVDYPTTIPAGARPAFKANGEYFMYVDDIHINNVVSNTVNETVCNNEDYSGHGITIPSAQMVVGNNTFTKTVQATTPGVSDTTFIFCIYKRPAIVSDTYDTICAGQPYNKGMWQITNPQSKLYLQTLYGASVNGCDSTVGLYLTVLPTTATINDTICQGDAYQFGSQTLTQSGTFSSLISSPYGCMISTTLNLVVLDSASHIYESYCGNSGYVWEGQTYAKSGVYMHTSTIKGCLHHKYLHLTVGGQDITIDTSFCFGSSIQIKDTVIRSSGTYHITRYDQVSGCNTTYHITAVEREKLIVYVSDSICDESRYSGYGLVDVLIKNDTVITLNYKISGGRCDSTVVISIKSNKTKYAEHEYVSIKKGEEYSWNGNTYSSTGIYYAILKTINGCDSICKLILSVDGEEPMGNVDAQSFNITIVPNPVNAGETAFIYGDFGSAMRVEVYNTSGKLVDAFTPDEYPIQIENIQVVGLYYVRIFADSGDVVVRKLMVK